MTDGNDMLPDHEIRHLLHTEPEPEPSAAQLARLRTRLELGGPEDSTVDTPIDIVHAPTEVEGGRRWGRALALAAALVVLAGLSISVLGSRDGADVSITDDDFVAFPTVTGQQVEPTPVEPAGSRYCSESHRPFVDAIAVWGGIEDWSFLSDRRTPEPDLVVLAEEALRAAMAVETSPGLEAAAGALGVLRSDGRVGSAIDAPFEWSRSEREAQRAAVTRALEELTSVVEDRGWSEFEGCS